VRRFLQLLSGDKMFSAVVITSRTATGDPNSFDFLTSKGIDNRVFAASTSVTCVRSTTQGVGVVPEPFCAGSDEESLLRVTRDQCGRFQLDRPFHVRRLWSVVRELPTSKHRLSEGDLLRFGRFEFRVKQLVESGEPIQAQFGAKRIGSCKSQSESASSVCRICLQEGFEEGNPFCAPCACKGSIADVHVGCLQHWVTSRVRREGGSFACAAPFCELCKKALPSHLVRREDDQARSALLQLPSVEPPFIVLDSLHRDKLAPHGMFHVLSLANGRATIGRGEDCQVRIAHCGISRLHATLRYTAGASNESSGFFLEDNNSKFGTTVACKRLPLTPDVPTTVQIDNTVLAVTLQSVCNPVSLGMIPVYAQEDSMSETRSRSDSSKSVEPEQELCKRVSNRP